MPNTHKTFSYQEMAGFINISKHYCNSQIYLHSGKVECIDNALMRLRSRSDGGTI